MFLVVRPGAPSSALAPSSVAPAILEVACPLCGAERDARSTARPLQLHTLGTACPVMTRRSHEVIGCGQSSRLEGMCFLPMICIISIVFVYCVSVISGIAIVGVCMFLVVCTSMCVF